MKKTLFRALAVLAALLLCQTALAGNLPAWITGGSVNLRESPEGDVIGTLHQGDRVRLLEYGAEWSLVRAEEPDAEGYVASQYLRLDYEPSLANSAVTAINPGDSMAQGGAFALDLDDDGDSETVSLFSMEDEYGNVICVRIAQPNGDCVDAVTDILTMTEARLLFREGEPCALLLSGEGVFGSESLCLAYGDGAFRAVPFCFDGQEAETLRGSAAVNEDGSIAVGRRIDCFGSWWGERAFSYQGGALLPEEDLWNISCLPSQFDLCALTVKQDLPITLSGGGETTLPAGTRLVLTGFDGVSAAYFMTQEGITGSISCSAGEDSRYTIAGVGEEEWFDGIAYED